MRFTGTGLLIALAAVGIAVCVAAAAFFDVLWMTRRWDAHVLLLNAQRIVELGGPWYQVAAEQKGPLWTALYVVGYAVGGPFNGWFVIASMVIGVALLTGVVIALIAGLVDGGTWPIGIAVGAAAAVWLMLGPEEYSYTLYSRNIVALLEVTAFAALMAIAVGNNGQSWRRDVVLAALAGALTGLAVQTNLASAPTGVVFGAYALVLDRAPRAALEASDRLRRPPLVTIAFALSGSLAFASAIVYYAVRGGLQDFLDLWWTYNRNYAEATGLTLLETVWKGINDFWRYHQSHPDTFGYANDHIGGTVLTAIVVVYVLDGWRRHMRGTSISMDAFVLLWWLATWLAVALPGRLFPHYLVLPFVPVAVMAALLAGRYVPGMSRYVRRMFPAVIVLVTLVTVGGPRLTAGIDRLLAFESLASFRAQLVAAMPPLRQDLRDVVQNNSPAGSYVYAWTNEPSTYTDLERRAPTRYVEQRWLAGEIYGGASPNPDVIPDGAWRKWAADIRATPPVLWIELDPYRPPAGSPAELLRDCGFREIYAATGQRVLARTGRSFEECLELAGV